MSTKMITKMTDRPVVLACPPGVSMASVRGTGLSLVPALLPVFPARVRNERPTQASAAAAKAQAPAYAFAAVANGAGAFSARGAEAGAAGQPIGQQKTTQHGKWAFRGLEPWSDPA
ncbi:hypothetical protein SAMN05216259_103349 [Actinacidiphila guanduensis]|uniref:Uncharacterized protein n=2 Tax=Actinacidiphila guanduensis TaxID=310781 RepID=A0A1G9ZY10_9ACTN|nr:hypothetical protein SAMN05216259_103349 [Actinacidiphila guanduensis]